MQQFILPYLAQHNVVSIKGIGSFVKDSIVSQWSAVSLQLEAPVTLINFFPDAEETTPSFIDYIKYRTNLSNNEIDDAINALQNNEEFTVQGIGHLTKGLKNYSFISEVNLFYKSIDAPKVIRQNAVHTITVGDHQFSNVAMQEYYDDTIKKPKGDFWFLSACILFALIIAYIVYYFYKNHN